MQKSASTLPDKHDVGLSANACIHVRINSTSLISGPVQMIGKASSVRGHAFLGNNRALSASSGLRRQTPAERGLSVRVEANELNQWGDKSGPEENAGLTDQAFEREVAGSVCKVLSDDVPDVKRAPTQNDTTCELPHFQTSKRPNVTAATGICAFQDSRW